MRLATIDVADNADLIHYTMGACEKEEEAIRKAVDFSITGRRARRQAVD